MLFPAEYDGVEFCVEVIDHLVVRDVQPGRVICGVTDVVAMHPIRWPRTVCVHTASGATISAASPDSRAHSTRMRSAEPGVGPDRGRARWTAHATIARPPFCGARMNVVCGATLAERRRVAALVRARNSAYPLMTPPACCNFDPASRHGVQFSSSSEDASPIH